jgi:hypothetical protein
LGIGYRQTVAKIFPDSLQAFKTPFGKFSPNESIKLGNLNYMKEERKESLLRSKRNQVFDDIEQPPVTS